MKKRRPFLYHIFIFVLAQLAMLSLLGIWIYWYVTNYLILSEVEDKISPQIISEGQNVFILVGGLALLILLSVALSILFHRLNIQSNLTHLYDNFIANVTHELKSPLASIQLALETMQFHSLPQKKQDEFIDMMLKDTSRLNNLINVILEIPALEQKKIAYNFHIYSVGSLIEELINETKEQLNLPDEAISISGSAKCQCVADRDALKIVIDNLVDNSIKYSLDTVKISINLNCGLQYFKLDYTDQGIGMTSQNLKKIFDKFYRVQDQDSPNVKGTGLGLYWIKEIIHFHAGHISASSRGKNKGTSFHIELPIYPELKKRRLQHLLKLAQRRQKQKEASHGK